MIQIPLIGGASNAHQVFSIQLGENFLTFELNYITLAGPAWSLDISLAGQKIIAGAMLEPGAVITENYSSNIGRLAFVGDDVTLDNLGVSNSLVWIADNEQL